MVPKYEVIRVTVNDYTRMIFLVISLCINNTYDIKVICKMQKY